jgi:hypothetical protein
MVKQELYATPNKCWKNERGAALVTVLLITLLLLAAVSALLLEASMNGSNVTDATAEDQAYYAAESGIQETLNVLRGNTVPNQLIVPTASPTDPLNQIDYLKATRLSTSNMNGDTSTESRLSRWLTYDTTYTDRVILGKTTFAGQPAYTPKNGLAYKIKIENPDNVGNVVSFNTTAKYIDDQVSSKKWTNVTTGNSLTISYVSTGTVTKDVSSGIANSDFGKFVVTGGGPTFSTTGVTIPTKVRFAFNVNLTVPYGATKVIRGYIEPGTISASISNVKITYDSQLYVVAGSKVTLNDVYEIPAPGIILDECISPTGQVTCYIYRVGYQIPLNPPNTNSGETSVNGTITAPEPTRLVVRSTGFGPRGAQKQLEAIIQKNYFNGLSAPSPLTLIGPPWTTPPNLPTTSFVFNPGTSNYTTYDGKDVLLKAWLPPIGVTNDTNLNAVNYGLMHGPPNKYNGVVYGTASNIQDELPFWLQSPTNLDDTLSKLKEVAKASGRYFKPGDTMPANGDYGNNANATGITYIDTDLEFSQTGGGILVVTGTLTFKGGFNFKGLIVVTGQGGIRRTGGGSGSLQGNMIVAPYLPYDLQKGFLAPYYNIDGGGGSEIVYNSNNVANGLGALSNFAKGVVER